MKRVLAMGLVFLTCSVNPNQKHLAAANEFTETYSKLPYRLRGIPAGVDCHVLLIQSGETLNDESVEGIQYGIPNFDRYSGGARQFAADHAFRAVVYIDPGQRIWTYGTISHEEATRLSPCR